jgi:aspartate aminotransferase-like enzyme
MFKMDPFLRQSFKSLTDITWHGENMDQENNLFMIPGPVKIHPRILRVMSKPAVGHRTESYRAMNGEIKELLQYLFQTKNDVTPISGSGTAGLDTVMTNLLKKGEKSVGIVNGKFGERLSELADFYGEGIVVKADYGQPPDLKKLEEKVAEHKPKLVTVCHNETSTGFTNLAKDIGEIAHKHGALFILDGITSIGGLDVPCDKWKVDAAIFGSQKCIGAPAGLAGVMVSEKAKEQLHDDKSYYLHLRKHIDKFMQKNDTPYTSAIPLFLALHEALKILKEDGLENRIKHYAALGQACRDAAKAIGLDLLPPEEYASNTVTAIKYPDGIDDVKFRKILREKHWVLVAGGQSVVKGKIFRIGHMGFCTFNDMLGTWGAIEATLRVLGYKFEHGSAVAAVEGHLS